MTSAASNGLKQRILFIEEDPAVLRGVSWLLKDSGYDVVALSAAGDIGSIIDRRSPDLILLDLDARGHDNYRVLSRIRTDARWADIPLVTTGSDQRAGSAGRIAGSSGPVSSDFVPKPLRASDLLARVAAQLRMRVVLRQAFESLRSTERELIRARNEADARREVVDILQEIHSDLPPDSIFALLVRRLGSALTASECAVLLAQPGDRIGHMVASYGSAGLRQGPLALDLYPEVGAALEHGRIILVENMQESVGGAPDVRGGVSVAADDFGRVSTPPRGVQLAGRVHQGVRTAIAVPFALDRGAGGVLLLRRGFDSAPFSEQNAELASAVAAAAVAAVQRARVIERAQADNARLEALAHTDPLTRVLNRRALMDRLTSEIDRATRYESIVSLLMIDIDHFKLLNDTHGHLAGDEALRWVAQTLQAAVRSVDLVARFGGEEFAIVLPETTMEGAFAFAERIRERIEAGRIRFNTMQLRLTVSIGVAAFPALGAESVEDIIQLADAALYRAKGAGRNLVLT